MIWMSRPCGASWPATTIARCGVWCAHITKRTFENAFKRTEPWPDDSAKHEWARYAHLGLERYQLQRRCHPQNARRDDGSRHRGQRVSKGPSQGGRSTPASSVNNTPVGVGSVPAGRTTTTTTSAAVVGRRPVTSTPLPSALAAGVPSTSRVTVGHKEPRRGQGRATRHSSSSSSSSGSGTPRRRPRISIRG